MSAFEDNGDMYYEVPRHFHAPAEKRCAHCGTCGLHLDDFGSGFHLYDDELKRHVCPATKPTPDDFDVL